MRISRSHKFGAKMVAASHVAKRTINPIRRVVERIQVKPNPDLPVIPLSIGDPTVFGNFGPPSSLAQKLNAVLLSGDANGYGHSAGTQEAREAVAQRFAPSSGGSSLLGSSSADSTSSSATSKSSSTKLSTRIAASKYPLTADDVVLTSGCSQALDLAIAVLANPGEHNILLPRPAFPLYETLCASRGIAVKHYRLDPNRQWEIDLADLEAQIDSSTSCILINSPSNPCGNVFSAKHLAEICDIARKHSLPIISDEIYADMAFPGVAEYTALNDISEDVPFLATGGLAKQYMIPGWRMGWVCVHDRQGAFDEIRSGLLDLSTLILGPSSLQQAVVGHLLHEVPQSYYDEVLQQLHENAQVITEELGGGNCPGLRVIEPQGAMYVLIEILDKSTMTDTEFTAELLKEQSVFVLPGKCFGVEGFFRVVVSPPKDKLLEACKRIRKFCETRWGGC